MVSHDGRDATDRSALELTTQLAGQLSKLVSDEIALAKAELFTGARQAALGSGLFAMAALLGLTAWLCIVATVIVGVTYAVPVWAAIFAVGGGLGLIGGGLALLGRKHLRKGTGIPPLRMTTESVRKELSELAASGSVAANGAKEGTRERGQR
jgi:type IV secretory pathway TrbD component